MPSLSFEFAGISILPPKHFDALSEPVRQQRACSKAAIQHFKY
jgi:hypothetical protein